MRIVYKTVKRITNETLGVKGLNETGINYQHVRDLGRAATYAHMGKLWHPVQHSLMIKNEGGIQLNGW